MTASDVDPETGSRHPAGPADDEAGISPCYQAYIEQTDGGRDVCTIYSEFNATAAEDTWIRAIGDAFVSREECR